MGARGRVQFAVGVTLDALANEKHDPSRPFGRLAAGKSSARIAVDHREPRRHGTKKPNETFMATMIETGITTRPATLRELRQSGWRPSR